MILQKLLPVIVLLTMIAACKKDNRGLPDVSAKGEYLNCQINGRYWTYKQCTDLFCNTDGLKDYSVYSVPDITTAVFIEASDVQSFPQGAITFKISQKDYLAGDTIMLAKNERQSAVETDRSWATIESPYHPDSSSYFETDSVNTGRLIFTKRTDHWDEGTFFFNAVNRQGQLVSITGGRFAISLD